MRHQLVSKQMIRLSRHVLGHPRLWLCLIALGTVALGAGLLRLELRTDGDALRPVGNPFVESTERDRVRFHDPRQTVLLVSSEPGGPMVASPEGFRLLREIQEELRALSAVRATGILSLAGLPRPVYGGGGFSVGTYLDEVSNDPAVFAAQVDEVREQRLTDGLLLSRDGRRATFYVPLVEQRAVPELIGEMEAWVRSYEGTQFSLQLTGPEVAEATLGHMVLWDLAVLVPIMIVVIIVLLFTVFGNLGGVIVPMAESLVVLIWTFGAMGWLGVPITLVTTILPVVLMAMSITDEIHLLERVQAHGAAQPNASLRSSVEDALVEVGRPIIATSVTTALGFLSFLSATIVPLRQFGLFTALGIVLAMVLSFVWIPALIISLPRRWFLPRATSGSGPKAGPALARWGVSRPGVAFALGLSLAALSIPGVFRLGIQDAWVDNFAPDTPLVQAERAFNDSFWGSYRFDVVFEAHPEFFYSPTGASLMEEFRRVAVGAPHVGGVLTYLAPLEEVQEAFGKPKPLSSVSALVVADLATVAEMSENRLRLRQLVTDGGEAARARLFVAYADYARAVELRDYLELHLPGLVAPHPVTYHYSGDLPAALAVVASIVRNQLRSIGWTLLTVTAALLLFFSRGKGAAISMVPVSAAVVMLLGGMGYAGIPLGIATSMFASLTVGVGVDFGVHLLHRYESERRSGLDHVAALRATVDKAGRAVGWNALVLALGFLVLTLSSLKPNHSLGVLLASAMVACYAATVMFLPRLLRLLAPTGVLILAAAFVLGRPTPTDAESVRCPGDPDAAAEAIVAKLERAFRSRPRIARMAIHTHYAEKHPLRAYFKRRPSEKVLWGIFNGDPERTRLLYVFSAPGRLAGTTLLIEDLADASKADGMWLYLRSFDSFTKLDPRAQRVMVPGTALTYEDARGFIALDKYHFSFTKTERTEPSKSEALLLGCPRSSAIRDNLGYDSLLVLIDKDKNIIRRVTYNDLGRKLLKSYELVSEKSLSGRWYPRRVKMKHYTDGYVTDITYEHWLLRGAPAPAIFRPETGEEKFLPRLERILEEAGLGDRIHREIAEANEIIRAYDERMRKLRKDR